MDTRVSVVVPLYNKAPYLSAALGSIQAQQRQPDEIIVVDDGSTDGGADIALAAGIPRLRLIRQTNQGPGAARNRGIAAATGDLVAFLDADDYWYPEYLAQAVEILAACPEAAAATSGYIDYPEKICRKGMWVDRGLCEGIVCISADTSPLLFTHMVAYMTPCTTVIRRHAIERHGGFAAGGCRYAEDAALWARVLLNEPVYFHLRPLVALHREASQLSSRSRVRELEPFLRSPADLEASCSPELVRLVRGFLRIRACKTAAVWGYWGKWREARDLMRRFVNFRDFGGPYFWAGRLGTCRISGYAGAAWRALSGMARRRRAHLDIPEPTPVAEPPQEVLPHPRFRGRTTPCVPGARCKIC